LNDEAQVKFNEKKWEAVMLIMLFLTNEKLLEVQYGDGAFRTWRHFKNPDET
jgi:hypothetical protein